MNQEQIDKLRAAGFTDDDIRDYQQNQPSVGNQPTQTAEETLPEIDVTKPSDIIRNAEATGVPTGARESSFLSDIATAAPVMLGENLGSAALGAGGLAAAYGANQVRKGMQSASAARNAQAAAQMAQAQAAMEQARAAQQTAQGVADRAAARQAAQAARAVPAGPQILDAQGRPMQAAPRPVTPIAPTGAAPIGPVAPSASAPGITAQIRAYAANKVLPMAGNLLKGSVAPGMAMYSGELGPKTPQVGRMRGMEINPLTGRPWTPDQIAQYESNPNMFDSQMAPPQMKR